MPIIKLLQFFQCTVITFEITYLCVWVQYMYIYVPYWRVYSLSEPWAYIYAQNFVTSKVLIRFVEIVFLQSKKREGEGAGGGNHRKVTAANGGRGQTF